MQFIVSCRAANWKTINSLCLCLSFSFSVVDPPRIFCFYVGSLRKFTKHERRLPKENPFSARTQECRMEKPQSFVLVWLHVGTNANVLFFCDFYRVQSEIGRERERERGKHCTHKFLIEIDAFFTMFGGIIIASRKGLCALKNCNKASCYEFNNRPIEFHWLLFSLKLYIRAFESKRKSH